MTHQNSFQIENNLIKKNLKLNICAHRSKKLVKLGSILFHELQNYQFEARKIAVYELPCIKH